MLYKYCQSVIINHGKATCFVTERTDKSKTTNSALDKGNWGKEHLLIAKKKRQKEIGGMVFRTGEKKYKEIVGGI